MPNSTIPIFRAVICAAALFSLYGVDRLAHAQMVEFNATAQATQFRDPVQWHSFGPAIESPTSVSVHDEEARRCAIATVAPFYLRAEVEAAPSGIPNPSSGASYRGLEIGVLDSPALRALIPSDQTGLDLLLNYYVDVFVQAPGPPGIFKQAVVGADVGIGVDSIYQPGIYMRGHIGVTNGPYEHAYDSSGILAGLPENGGQVSVSLPVRISPFAPGGLVIKSNADVQTGALSLSPDARAEITLSLADGPAALTLLNGIPLSSLGVEYNLAPNRDYANVISVPCIPSDFPGETPEAAQMPSSIVNAPGGPFFRFTGPIVLGPRWYDPPLADGFIYASNSESLFTSIADFPPGFESDFAVSIDGILLPGRFGPGDHVVFSDYANLLGTLLVNNEGVARFAVTGIDPLVDTGDPAGFPLKITFNNAPVDFTMTPLVVPEPSTWILACAGLFTLASCGLHRRMNKLKVYATN